MALMYRVQQVFTGLGGSPFLSTFFFAASSGTSEGAAAAANAFWSDISPVISSQLVRTQQSEVATIESADGSLAGVSNFGPATENGSDTGAPLPPMVQGLLNLRTGIIAGGKRINGRIFIPGATEENSAEGGAPISSYISGIQDAFADLVADPDSGVCVWSRVNGTAVPVTSGDLWEQWAVLRSRRD